MINSRDMDMVMEKVGGIPGRGGARENIIDDRNG
jgi:hypothetical protein